MDTRSKAGRTEPRLSPDPSTESESDANERLLARMEAMMDNMRTDIVSQFEQIVSGAVKKEITAALGPLESKITAQSQTIANLEEAANSHDEQLTSLNATVAVLESRVESLSQKCEDLEGRSRLNNIRLVGVPEGAEGSRPTEFIAKLIQNLLGLDSEPVLDRAHRTLRARGKDEDPPRPFVARVNMFQIRCEILRKAGSSGPLLYQGKRVYIFPDFTASVAKKRAAFTRVKKELHSCPGVKFGLFHPAVLRITLPSGQARRFEDPALAMDYVQKHIKTVVTPDSDVS